MNEREPIFTPEEAARLRRLRRTAIRTVAILAVAITFFLITGFFLSATPLPKDRAHDATVPPSACLSCHDPFRPQGVTPEVPPMPHRPFPGCLFCHRPTVKDQR